MVKTATTPPEEEDVSGILISDLSNPIWGELLRLLEDQEQAAVVLDILVQAITSRAIEEDLPEASREEHARRAIAPPGEGPHRTADSTTVLSDLRSSLSEHGFAARNLCCRQRLHN